MYDTKNQLIGTLEDAFIESKNTKHRIEIYRENVRSQVEDELANIGKLTAMLWNLRNQSRLDDTSNTYIITPKQDDPRSGNGEYQPVNLKKLSKNLSDTLDFLGYEKSLVTYKDNSLVLASSPIAIREMLENDMGYAKEVLEEYMTKTSPRYQVGVKLNLIKPRVYGTFAYEMGLR